MSSNVSNVKRAQKESLLYRAISQLFMQTALDDSRLQGLMINRVQLSPDKGVCSIFFYSSGGEEAFNEQVRVLTLYKPSLRKALAASIPGRYTPELVFKFDKQFEKQQRIEALIESVKSEPETSES